MTFMTIKRFTLQTGNVFSKEYNAVSGAPEIDINGTGQGSITIDKNQLTAEERKNFASTFTTWATGVILYDKNAAWNSAAGIFDAFIVTGVEQTLEGFTLHLDQIYQYLLKIGPLTSAISSTITNIDAEVSYSSGTWAGVMRSVLNASLNPSPLPAGHKVPPFVLPTATSGTACVYKTTYGEAKSAAEIIEEIRESEASNGEEILIRPEWTTAAQTTLRFRVTFGTAALPHINYIKDSPISIAPSDTAEPRVTDLSVSLDASFIHNKIVVVGENAQTKNNMTASGRPTLIEVENLGNDAVSASVTKIAEARQKTGEQGSRDAFVTIAAGNFQSPMAYLGQLIHIREAVETLGITTKLRCTSVRVSLEEELLLTLELQQPAARYRVKRKEIQDATGGSGTGKNPGPGIMPPPTIEIPGVDLGGETPGDIDLGEVEEGEIPDWTEDSSNIAEDPKKMTIVMNTELNKLNQTNNLLSQFCWVRDTMKHAYKIPSLTLNSATRQLTKFEVSYLNPTFKNLEGPAETWTLDSAKDNTAKVLDSTEILAKVNAFMAANIPASVLEHTTAAATPTRFAPIRSIWVRATNFAVIKGHAYMQIVVSARYKTNASADSQNSQGIMRHRQLFLTAEYDASTPQGIKIETLEELQPVGVQNVSTESSVVALFKQTFATTASVFVAEGAPLDTYQIDENKWVFANSQLLTDTNPVTVMPAGSQTQPNYKLDYLEKTPLERARTIDYVVGDFEVKSPYFRANRQLIASPSPNTAIFTQRAYYDTDTRLVVEDVFTPYVTQDIWRVFIAESGNGRLLITPTPQITGWLPQVANIDATIQNVFAGRYKNKTYNQKIRYCGWIYNPSNNKMSTSRRTELETDVDIVNPPTSWGRWNIQQHFGRRTMPDLRAEDIINLNSTQNNRMTPQNEATQFYWEKPVTSLNTDILLPFGPSSTFTGETGKVFNRYEPGGNDQGFWVWTPDASHVEAKRFINGYSFVDNQGKMWVRGRRSRNILPTAEGSLATGGSAFIKIPLSLEINTFREIRYNNSVIDADVAIYAVADGQTRLFKWGMNRVGNSLGEYMYKPIELLWQAPEGTKIKQLYVPEYTTVSSQDALIGILLENNDLYVLGALPENNVFGIAGGGSRTTPQKANFKALRISYLNASIVGETRTSACVFINDRRELESRLKFRNTENEIKILSGNDRVKNVKEQLNSTRGLNAGFSRYITIDDELKQVDWNFTVSGHGEIKTPTLIAEGVREQSYYAADAIYLKPDGLFYSSAFDTSQNKWIERPFDEMNSLLEEGEKYETLFEEYNYNSSDYPRHVGRTTLGRVVGQDRVGGVFGTQWLTGGLLGQEEEFNFFE